MLNIRKIAASPAAEEAAGFVLALAVGYLLSDAQMAGVASFADISLTGALSLPHSAAMLTGSLVHNILQGSVGKNIVKITTMIIIIISKLFFERSDEPKFSGVSTAISVFLSGTAVSVLIGEMLYKLLFYVFYGTLSGFTTYSIAVIIQGIQKKRALDLSSVSGCAYAVVYTISVATLCSVKVPLVNIGLILGSAVTLIGAFYYRHTGGVLCGSLTTCGAFLASPEQGMKIVLLPAAALLTGYIYKQKYTIVGLFFVSINFMLIILAGTTQNSIDGMLDIICGTLLFALVVPVFSDQFLITAHGTDHALPEIMNSRMDFISDSISSVRSESAKLAEFLTKSADDRDEIEEISGKMCTYCFRRLNCWKSDHERTLKGFRKLSLLTEFSREKFPYELEDCLHKEEMAKMFEASYRERSTAKLLDMKFSENRVMMFEHLKIIEEMIKAAGERINVRYSETISKQISTTLTKHDIAIKNVIAYYNSNNRLLIELYFEYRNAPSKFTRIRDLVSDEIKMPLEAAEPISSGREIRVRLFEKPAFFLEVCEASVCAGNGKENGDTSMTFSDGTGISYIVLSDGMGSGKKAAVESKMVVRIFRKLVSSGVNCNSAIKLINSIMLTKSQEESFATLDAARIDLDTCELTLIKSGASSTLIRHRGNVMKISSPTFPIGIYEQSDIFSQSYDFEENDIIIMFSDGINEGEYLYIKELLTSENDLKKIVDEICAKSEVFNPTVRSDDVTVIGIRIKRS